MSEARCPDRVRITVMRVADYADLSALYELPQESPCSMSVGDVFETRGERPDGVCESAWETMRPFVEELLSGGGSFYGDWMRDPHSAMLSCNDGFRPVSFYIEAVYSDGEKYK